MPVFFFPFPKSFVKALLTSYADWDTQRGRPMTLGDQSWGVLFSQEDGNIPMGTFTGWPPTKLGGHLSGGHGFASVSIPGEYASRVTLRFHQ